MKNQRQRLLAILIVTAGASSALTAPPQISFLQPLALKPGETTELHLFGQNLQDARQLWTTFVSRCEFAPASDETSQKGEKTVCLVTVPRNAQVGIGALRLVTSEGVSNPLLLMLDDLRSVAESSDNHHISQAQKIDWPVAVDGQCDAVQEDLFRFHAAAGQRLSFEVVSQRLGSQLDPLLRLLTLDGRIIAQQDDATGVGGDSRLSYEFTSDGDYLLALRDIRYAGGSGFRYRLRVGSFPLVSSVYPPGGRCGEVATFQIMGDQTDQLKKVHVSLPEGLHSPQLVSFDLSTAENAGSGWFTVEASPGNESSEQEPNDSVNEASEALVPGALNGRFNKASDRDHFRFSAQKGQRIHCVAMTRELGSACDVFLSLHKADGKHLASARQERQTILDAELPEDGQYVLRVENLLLDGEPGHVYRIRVSDTYTGFSLSTEHTQYTVPQGGTLVVKVIAQRSGYNGPIELAVEGLGDGVTLEGNMLEGTETLLKITIPAEIPQGALRHMTIVGKAKVGEQTVLVQANQREALAALFPNALSVPTQLQNEIAVGIGPSFPPFFELGVATKEVYFPQIVGTSSFDVHVIRKNDAFKDPVSVVVEGLPKEILSEITPVDDGMKTVRVSLKGPVDFAEAEFPFRIVGTGKFQEQTHRFVLGDMVLRVTKPLVVSLSMVGPIAAGGQAKAEVHLTRFGDEPQPVRLQFADGPAGLLAPISVTVPSDATRAEIPVAVATTAAVGRFDHLVVVASTTVKGQNVSVRSKAASLEILPPPAEK